MPLVILGGLSPACGRDDAPTLTAGARPVARGVKLGAARSLAVEERVEVPGTVRSRTRATLSSRVVGNIVAVHVHEGSRVQAGQPLVELDDREVKAALRRARAAVEEGEAGLAEVDRAIAGALAARDAAEAQGDLASATLTRYRRLLERRSVAPQEYDQVLARHRAASADLARAEAEIEVLQAKRRQVQARIEAARAEVAAAEVMRDYTRIVAPLSGVVTAKHADVGTLAAPGVPLLTLEDAGRYRLEVTIPETHATALQVGRRLAAEVPAAGVAGPAQVVEIVPAADPGSRTVLARLELPTSPRLASGQFGRAWIPGGRREILALDAAAVVRRGQLTGVYVVDSDRVVRFRLVTTGEARQGLVEVLSGLVPGETVVVAGLDRVTDGAVVEDTAPER